MSGLNWKELIEVIYVVSGLERADISRKINDVTSIFAKNCFNCLSWENLGWPDYWVLTRCEDPKSRTCWLNNSSSIPACDNFAPHVETDHLN